MITCDHCKKCSGRLYVFGDGINENYEHIDLCFDCAKVFLDLFWRYKNGDDLVVDHRFESEVSNG